MDGLRLSPVFPAQNAIPANREMPQTPAGLLPSWGTRVLFPGPPRPDEEPNTPSRTGAVGLGLLLVAASILFFLSLRAPLLEPQEARYAEIPRQMLTRGEWVTPCLHGEPYLDKPPL